jgi:hypothetical protein
MLSSHLRSEFLAVPQLVRLDMAYGEEGLEPTLLVKASSLSLKYLLRRQAFKLIVTRVGPELAYAVEIPDDPEKPATAWSLLERQNEVDALTTLITNPRCVVFLFNELAVSVAWTEVYVMIDATFSMALESLNFHTIPRDQDAVIVSRQLDQIRAGVSLNDTRVLTFESVHWNELHAIYITNQAGASSLSLFNKDEGGQQEEIAVWLTDSLHPGGCFKSPRVHEKVSRELSDILLSHEYGAILVESKALAILTRDNLPNRDKLARDLTKHVSKAAAQLAGGIRNLHNNRVITDKGGVPLDIERKQPAHAIILVPDLSLLEHASELGPKFVYEFMKATGGYLHILDPAELLRVVQEAEMIARDSTRVSTIMAFDWYLMERAKLAATHPSPSFAVLFRKEPPGPDSSSE